MSVALAVLAALAGGETPLPTVAATIEVPNIAADKRGLGDERKFFVFHQQGVTLEQARADLSYCFRYTVTGPGIVFPYFHPWNSHGGAGKPATYDLSGQYGLVGALIGTMIAGGLERSKRQISLMRCMLPRGYSRYRISEGLWKEINGGDPQRAVEIQARLASGPVPPTPKVLP